MNRFLRCLFHLSVLFVLTGLLMCVYTPLTDDGHGGIALWKYVLYALYLSVSVYIMVPQIFRAVSEPSGDNALQATLSFITFIGITLVVYPFGWEGRFTDWRYYSYVILDTVTLGIVPFLSYALYRNNRKLKQKLHSIVRTSAWHTSAGQRKGAVKDGDGGAFAHRLLEWTDENGKTFGCSTESFVYAESQKNYTAIFYLQDETVKSTTLRIPLKTLEMSVCRESQFMRCHRSFLINLNHMVCASGNSNGYQVVLRGCATAIPISRAYVEDFVTRTQTLPEDA